MLGIIVSFAKANLYFKVKIFFSVCMYVCAFKIQTKKIVYPSIIKFATCFDGNTIVERNVKTTASHISKWWAS